MNEMTAFQRDLLYIIHDRDEPHGLEIKAAVETYYGKEVNHGRLYPNLDELVDRGLVTKGEYDKRTNKYGLTREGKQTLLQRANWEHDRLEDLIEDPATFTEL